MSLQIHNVRAIAVGPEKPIGGGTAVRTIFVYVRRGFDYDVIELTAFGKAGELSEVKFFDNDEDAREYDPAPALGDADTGHR